MIKALGYATSHSFSRLKPISFERQEAGSGEVEIDILYCGVCHSDIHQAENDWGNTVYPCVPGHEIVGRVTVAGAGVTRHKVGDLVGVGCMIDSCRTCEPCQEGEQQPLRPRQHLWRLFQRDRRPGRLRAQDPGLAAGRERGAHPVRPGSPRTRR